MRELGYDTKGKDVRGSVSRGEPEEGASGRSRLAILAKWLLPVLGVSTALGLSTAGCGDRTIRITMPENNPDASVHDADHEQDADQSQDAGPDAGDADAPLRPEADIDQGADSDLDTDTDFDGPTDASHDADQSTDTDEPVSVDADEGDGSVLPVEDGEADHDEDRPRRDGDVSTADTDPEVADTDTETDTDTVTPPESCADVVPASTRVRYMSVGDSVTVGGYTVTYRGEGPIGFYNFDITCAGLSEPIHALFDGCCVYSLPRPMDGEGGMQVDIGLNATSGEWVDASVYVRRLPP